MKQPRTLPPTQVLQVLQERCPSHMCPTVDHGLYKDRFYVCMQVRAACALALLPQGQWVVLPAGGACARGGMAPSPAACIAWCKPHHL